MAIGVCLEYVPNKAIIFVLYWEEFREDNWKINARTFKVKNYYGKREII